MLSRGFKDQIYKGIYPGPGNAGSDMIYTWFSTSFRSIPRLYCFRLLCQQAC